MKKPGPLQLASWVFLVACLVSMAGWFLVIAAAIKVLTR